MNRRERRRRAKLEKRPAAETIDALVGTAVAHQDAGRLAEAEALWTRLLRSDPDHADALNMLGVLQAQTGRFDSAADLLSRAVALEPAAAGYHNNLGNVLTSLGKPEEAATAFERALIHQPDNPQFHNNLGTVLRMLGRFEEARTHYRRAIALEPDYAEAHGNYGNVLMDLDRIEDAAASQQRALELKPGYAIAHNNLGNALKRLGRYQEAVESYRRAVALDGGYGDALNNLGEALKERGEVEQAVTCYQRALAAGPGRATSPLGIHANLLFALNCLADADAATVFAEHVRWAERFPPPSPAHDNPVDPDRRLRVGYVSADFRRHSVAYFIEPVLEAHDRAAVEVFAYANVARPDAVSERLRGLVGHWVDIHGAADDAVARRIRDDGIDILVDLAGHTMDSRLPVFALKPAPVQVTWLGYPNTTGLAAMDFRLTDAVADPDGTDAFHTERLVRLTGGFNCYRPPADAPEGTPTDPDRPLTFGSCNNLAKVTPQTVGTWAAILHGVPGSRLLLKAKALADGDSRARIEDLFAAHGIAAERLELTGWITEGSPLGIYHGIDVGLDTFPYNGTTTTCEALWMGVPVVTLAGDRHAARVGASLLGRVGLGDLVADSPAAYVETALALAADAARRAKLRTRLRSMMASSELTDGAAFTARVEAVFRQLWNDWCTKAQGSRKGQ